MDVSCILCFLVTLKHVDWWMLLKARGLAHPPAIATACVRLCRRLHHSKRRQAPLHLVTPVNVGSGKSLGRASQGVFPPLPHHVTSRTAWPKYLGSGLCARSNLKRSTI